MNKTFKTIIISFASALLLTVLGFVLVAVLTLSGIGNPIIKFKATRLINNYIEQTYPNNDFEKIDVRYNFKFGGYGTNVASKSSIDTNFYISYDEDEIYDAYDEYVLSGMNTYNRICQELDNQVEAIVTEHFGEQVELFIYDLYSIESKSDSMNAIVENVGFDEHIGLSELNDLNLSPTVTAWFISDTMSFDILAEKFSQTKKLMQSKSIPASVYSISLRFPDEMIEGRHKEQIGAHDFPTKFIDSDEFMEKLIEYYEAGNETKDKDFTPQPTIEPKPEPTSIPVPDDGRTIVADGFFYKPLDDEIIDRITGLSYPDFEQNDITYESLNYIQVLHYDFNGYVFEGELIVAEDLAEEITDIFYQLYLAKYPINSIMLIDEFGGSEGDKASMTSNNTSSFNYRTVSGTNKLSKHALGRAIDINPMMNPYVKGDYVSPENGLEYADRSDIKLGMIDENDLCYKIFTEHGWEWGGDWIYSKDYQHFQK